MVKDRIEAILKEKGMTKGELAEKIGVSPQSLSRSLNSCSERTLHRMAKALDVDWHDLKEKQTQPEVQEQTPETAEPQVALNGYVECRGKVFRILTKEDIYKVLAYCDGYTINKDDDSE